LKLYELGPRMKLKLIKIEEGLCRGNVVFHSLINKSKAEIKKQLDSLKSKRELKEKRKREQEENIKKKQEKIQEQTKDKTNQNEEDGEELVSDVEGAEVDETQVAPKKTELKKPNAKSLKVRPAGISKGLWKKEMKVRADPKASLKKERRGARKAKEEGGIVLGKKRTKTATSHARNTSTFKN
jgi:hypothetical protein